VLPQSYNHLLVVLSYVVAVFGSYAALSIASRLSDPRGELRVSWLLGGAFAQGTGIWSMHFTGMLALHLPVPVSYNVALTASSFLTATVGSLFALWLTQRPNLSRNAVVAGGISIGAAISGLHYMDMAAMRMPAMIRYSSRLVFASIIVAIVFGLLSLDIGRRYHRDDPRRSRLGQWIAAAIMGIAISGMHYTGMAAANFYNGPEPTHWFNGPSFPAQDLPAAVLLSTLLILAIALGGVAIDRREAARSLISRRLLGAQESERRRIATVLHEDVGQLLTALRLNLQRFTPGGRVDSSVVGDSLALVDQALKRVRALSVELRPSVLDDLGLAAAVTWYANRLAERAGYAVLVEHDLGNARFPEAVETAAFRITQQALTNIARHAQAKNVHVALRSSSRAVELTVSDDGIGFDVRDAQMRSRIGESLGLVDMAEQAKLAGGTLTVTSGKRKGSAVRVRLPLGAFQ
jgi:NO-binding membrane sensor protein with MHYT domain/two-component sensor histidine kinase